MSKEKPSDSLELKIFSDTITIDFPNNRQLIAISVNKAKLSHGLQREILFASDRTSDLTYSTIEMASNFQVLIPKEKFKINILDLKPHETSELMKEYNEKYFPWFQSWLDFLNGSELDKDKDDTKDGESS